MVSHLVEAVLALRVRYVFSVSSWIRSPAHNAGVGGVPNSRHQLGLAMDIVLDDKAQAESLKADAKRLGLTAIDEGDHIHVQV